MGTSGKILVELDTKQTKIWCTLIAVWIPKATNTQSEYVILIAFPLQQLLHERSSMLRYTYIVCLVCVLKIEVLEMHLAIARIRSMVLCYDDLICNTKTSQHWARSIHSTFLRDNFNNIFQTLNLDTRSDCGTEYSN
jgi:hypothetical protein